MINITKIYLITNIDNNPNKIYIGKTKNSRESKHKLKYGSQIIYTYIDEVNSLNYKDWEPLETYWIEQFKQWGFEVINKRKKGGSGPEYWTEEQKIKHKKPRPGSGPKFRSEEVKIKISKGNKNKPKPKNFNSHLSQPILQYDLNGNLINEWKNSSEASKNTGIKKANIQNCYLGRCKTTGGFYWKAKKF
jgi:hypothetical protein